MLIYKALNVELNKSYIGQTTQILNKRKIQHESLIGNDNNYFHNALGKYGVENFKWVILEECQSQDELDYLETYYIKKFKTNNKEFGYNSTTGGERPHLNEKSKNKMSIKAKLRSDTEKHKIRFHENMNNPITNQKRIKTRIDNGSSKGEKNGRYVELNLIELEKMFKRNVLIPDIAKYFNVGTGTIGRRLKTLGLKRKKVVREETKKLQSISFSGKGNARYNHKIDNEKIKELFLEGKSPYQISKLLDYPSSTVRRRIDNEIRT